MNLWTDRTAATLGRTVLNRTATCRTGMSRTGMGRPAMIGIMLAGLLSACTPPAIDDYPAETPESVSGAAAADSAAASTVATPRTASLSSAGGIRASATATEGADASAAQSAADALAVKVGEDATYGAHLVDGEGRAFYLFTSDTPNTSTCTGTCAETWPPALTDATPLPGDGVDAALLGITLRDDGRAQATYNGHPLYYFSADAAAGEARGQGTRGLWFLVSPAGEQVTE